MPPTIRLLVTPLAKFQLQSATGILQHPLHVSNFSVRYISRRTPSFKPSFAAHRSPSSTWPSFPTQTLVRLFSGKKNSHLRSWLVTARGPPWKETSRAHTNQASVYPAQTQLSSLGSWSVVVAIGLVSATAVIYQVFLRRKIDLDEKVEGFCAGRIGRNAWLKAEDWSKMTGESLPGRPGNLNPDQEEKLRELWIATLQVFGVLDTQHAKEVIGSNNVEPLTGTLQKAENGTSKKRRIPLFGRKHRDSDTESTTSTDSSATTPTKTGAELEDKYGQTKQFHDTLAQQSPETLRATFWSMVKHDHPDALLLRFLRARKWDVEKALIMMISTMNWRHTEMHVDDDIMKNGEPAALKASHGSDTASKRLGEDFLAQMRMGKSFLHGIDEAGRPMCFVRVRLHKQGEQTEESLERYTVFIIESARMVLAPPIDTACVVFDMTGFSLANMDYSPVKFMIKCFEANYPESLGVVLVHKAPWVFQGIWKIIKGWLDPVVASKVKFTNSIEDLGRFIPRTRIPQDLGGEEDWSYHYIEPRQGENDAMKDTETRDKLIAERANIVKEYEKATLEWIDHSKEPEVSTIKEARHKLANTLREDYWKLDPYIRARSLYDRNGVIQKGGVLQFYPPAPAPVAAIIATPSSTEATETSTDDVD